MNDTYYKLDSKGKVRFWSIKVEGNVRTTQDGLLGGKAKEPVVDVCKEGKNIGKANETSPAEQALSEAKRKVELKIRKGYSLAMPTGDSGAPEFDDSFFNSPPRNFVGPKPLSKMPDKLLDKYEAEGRLIFSRKWNGMCSHIVIGMDGEPRIFTSAMDEKTLSFPKQVAALKEMRVVPGSWFMAEAIHTEERDGLIYDCPDRMKTVFGHSADKAVAWQEENGLVEFQVFNCLFYNGKELTDTYENRLNLCACHFASMYPFDVPVGEPSTYKEALTLLASSPHYEGYVIWDKQHTVMPIKWGGAPSRKGGAWKLKNFKEADVLIYDWDTGKGSLNDDVATLHYGLYDADGNIVHFGKGGSGLNAENRAEIIDADLPLVCELKYEEITKAGKFRLPVILRLRDDKPASECTVESVVNV